MARKSCIRRQKMSAVLEEENTCWNRLRGLSKTCRENYWQQQKYYRPGIASLLLKVVRKDCSAFYIWLMSKWRDVADIRGDRFFSSSDSRIHCLNRQLVTDETVIKADFSNFPAIAATFVAWNTKLHRFHQLFQSSLHECCHQATLHDKPTSFIQFVGNKVETFGADVSWL